MHARFFAGVLLTLACLPLEAHLLNMSRVTVDLEADRAVSIEMELDLNGVLGGPERYLAVSRLEDPLAAEGLPALIQTLEASTRITVAGQPLPVEVTGLTMPDATDEEFLNPMIWPRATLRLRGDTSDINIDNPGPIALQGQFQTDFGFEEPIALTFRDVASDSTMTRWLAVRQKSPLFDGTSWWLSGPSAGPAPVLQATIDWAEVRHYLWLGFTHILPGGTDHLLFVLGIYLGAVSLRILLALITTFTLAHTVTLIVSTIGIVRLPAGIVEPLIAASIVWVAVENLLPRQHLARKIALVFAFGLLHGMGFASALKDVGLPETAFISSMVSFNVGVELGQIMFIAGVLLLTGWFRTRPWYRARLVVPASIVVGLVAAFWTVQRLI